jgi:nucleoside phosphorylase
MASVAPPRDRGDFHVALICALSLEAECVQEVFDKFWEDEGKRYGKAPGDANDYTPGVIGEHNVVLAYMPGMGVVSAAAVAGAMRISYPNIKLALVVGVCGGIPHTTDQQDIVLGDIIISQALIQYDFGRQYPAGFKRKSGV